MVESMDHMIRAGDQKWSRLSWCGDREKKRQRWVRGASALGAVSTQLDSWTVMKEGERSRQA